MVDLTAHLLKITAHPALPGDARQLFGPIATGLEHITRQSVGHLDVHKLHANFAGTDVAGVWKVAQLSHRLDALDTHFTSSMVRKAVDHYRKSLSQAIVKEQTKADARRAAESGSFRGRGRFFAGRGRGRRGRGGGFGNRNAFQGAGHFNSGAGPGRGMGGDF